VKRRATRPQNVRVRGQKAGRTQERVKWAGDVEIGGTRRGKPPSDSGGFVSKKSPSVGRGDGKKEGLGRGGRGKRPKLKSASDRGRVRERRKGEEYEERWKKVPCPMRGLQTFDRPHRGKECPGDQSESGKAMKHEKR